MAGEGRGGAGSQTLPVTLSPLNYNWMGAIYYLPSLSCLTNPNRCHLLTQM